MATAVFTASDLALSSSFTCTYNSGTGSYVHSRTSTGSGTLTFTPSIPAGSSINSCTFSSAVSGATSYGGTTKVNNVTIFSGNNTYSVGVSYASTISVSCYFATNFHSPCPYNPGTYTGTRTFASNTITVDYTPPTSASVSNVRLDASASNIYKGAGAGMTLSWDALNGTNNPISSYSIYYRDNAGSWAAYATGIGSTSYTVTAHPTAGSNRQFYVIAYAPYGNSGTITSPIAYSFSAVSIPAGVGINPATVFPDANVTLSWTPSTGGVGTSVTGYQILENDTAKTTVTASPYVFSAPAAGSYTYKVAAIASVSGYNSGQSAGVALTVQPPASAFTLDKSTVAMDGAATIMATITPVNPAYNHDVTFALDATRTSTANVAAGSTTRTFTVPLAWCVGVPNATSGQATCTVVTRNGTTVIGQTATTFAVTVPATVLPTVTLAIAAVNGFGAYYLKGISSVRLTSTAAGAQGSTIASQSLVGGGYSGSVSPFTTGVLTTVGTNAVSVTVTDSRSRQATSTPASINVTDYAAPVIFGVTAFRSNVSGTAQETGEYVAVRASLVVTALTGNSGVATVRSRITGGTWSTAVAITHNTTVILSGILQTNAYEVEITLTDTVGTVSTHSLTIRKSQFMFDFRMDRAGVGQLAQSVKTLTVPDDWTTNINADKLDGQHASEFAASVHTHSYAPLTGGGTSGSWPISITGSSASCTGSSASCTGNAATATTATTAGRAYPYRVGGVDLNFNWSGQAGQPPWLWGGSDGSNMYVYNPSNFSVANANTVGGRSIYAGTAGPSGGVSGDIYIKYI